MAGRPKREFKAEDFEKLLALQCTQEEVCGFFECDHKTLTSWIKREYGEASDFSQCLKIYGSEGKISLRRNLLRLSARNASVAIFLSKNWLAMSDNVEVKADTSLMSALLDVVKGKQDCDESDEETKDTAEEDLAKYIL